MQTDPLADFLTQIRNANQVNKAEVVVSYSRLRANVADVLKKEGYIQDFAVEKRDERQKLVLKLKVDKKKKAITGLKRVSRPGLRRYASAGEIPRVLGGLGVAILSTSKGVMSGHEAKKQNVGGEVLAFVW